MTRSAIAAGDGAGYRDRFEWPLSSGAYVGSGSSTAKSLTIHIDGSRPTGDIRQRRENILKAVTRRRAYSLCGRRGMGGLPIVDEVVPGWIGEPSSPASPVALSSRRL